MNDDLDVSCLRKVGKLILRPEGSSSMMRAIASVAASSGTAGRNRGWPPCREGAVSGWRIRNHVGREVICRYAGSRHGSIVMRIAC